jgi:hypothetical protein
LAESAAQPRISERPHPNFFLWAAIACVFIAFGGFTPTYFAPIATGTLRQVSFAVHVHGFLFFGWTFLFLAQITLVGTGHRSLHRTVGMVGISWATAMVIFGVLVNLLSNAHRFADGEPELAYVGLLSGTGAMIAFGSMFTLAISNVRRPDYHKRFMLLATTAILGAATGRLWLPLFDFERVPMWLWRSTQDLPILALFAYDWRTLGKPHFVTAVFGTLLVVLHLLNIPIASTEPFQAIARMWFSLAG